MKTEDGLLLVEWRVPAAVAVGLRLRVEYKARGEQRDDDGERSERVADDEVARMFRRHEVQAQAEAETTVMIEGQEGMNQKKRRSIQSV